MTHAFFSFTPIFLLGLFALSTAIFALGSAAVFIFFWLGISLLFFVPALVVTLTVGCAVYAWGFSIYYIIALSQGRLGWPPMRERSMRQKRQARPKYGNQLVNGPPPSPVAAAEGRPPSTHSAGPTAHGALEGNPEQPTQNTEQPTQNTDQGGNTQGLIKNVDMGDLSPSSDVGNGGNSNN